MTSDKPQIAIVAGAAGALGHATTLTLAAHGATVVAVDRNESRGCGTSPVSVRREVADPADRGRGDRSSSTASPSEDRGRRPCW